MSDIDTEFWKLAFDGAEESKPEDVNEGDAVTIEYRLPGGTRVDQIAIVERRWTGEDGQEKLAFRKPHRGEIYAPPVLRILAGERPTS